MTTPLVVSAPPAPRRGLPPAAAVGVEFARALGGLALLPARAIAYLTARRRLVDELAADLEAEVEPESIPLPPLPTDRPLRLFLSCAEPSGEIHARRLARAIREHAAAAGAPEPELTGLGGPRLASDGVRILGDPVSRAAMGFDGVVGALPFYLGLLRRSAQALREGGFDALVPVDSPALHVPLGRIARSYGVPVVHYITPQYWGWAPWRSGGYRSAVDLALTIFPFEPAWFARRRIQCAHVGHPLLDALEGVPVREDAHEDGGDELVLLPGSRSGVVRRNLPWMLAAVEKMRRVAPEVRVVLPHDRAEMAPLLQELVDSAGATAWARVAAGDLHGVLARARAAFSVSGTVLLDLLHHRLPTVVLYRLRGPRDAFLSRHFLTAPYFASINLLAGGRACPEFCFHGEGPLEEVSTALAQCYKDLEWRRTCRQGLERAARRLGPAGAADRAAAQVLRAAVNHRTCSE